MVSNTLPEICKISSQSCDLLMSINWPARSAETGLINW